MNDSALIRHSSARCQLNHVITAALKDAIDEARQCVQRPALFLDVAVAIVHALDALNDVPKRPLGNLALDARARHQGTRGAP